MSEVKRVEAIANWHFRLGLDVSCHLSLDEKTMGILWKASFFGTGTAIGPWW